MYPYFLYFFFFSFFFSSSPLDKLDSRFANLLSRDKRERCQTRTLLLCKSAFRIRDTESVSLPGALLFYRAVSGNFGLGSKLFTEAIDFPRKPVLTRPVERFNYTVQLSVIKRTLYIYIYVVVPWKIDCLRSSHDVDVIFCPIQPVSLMIFVRIINIYLARRRSKFVYGKN